MDAGTSRQLERRRLNETLEDSIAEVMMLGSNLKQKVKYHKGVITGDLQDFYVRFNFIFLLTSGFKEMEPKKEGDDIDIAKKKTEAWLNRDVGPNISPQELTVYVKQGLDAFDMYYHVLVHQGFIAMPTKKG